MLNKRLTLKQELFVYEYLIDLNATQAAIRAGYSRKTAYSIGFENLKKPEIAKAIQVAANERIKRTEIDADWVLHEQVKVYKRCMQDLPILDKEGNPAGEYKFNAAGANRALESIGKHTSVNAFKPIEDDGKPIDYNWVVTFVDAKSDGSKGGYDRREKSIEHIL